MSELSRGSSHELGYGARTEITSQLYKQKKWHKLEALRVAVEGQLKRDREEFEKSETMRCWSCIGFLENELKRIKREQKAIEKRAGL